MGSVIGRKRSSTGVLVEVRAIGDDYDDLTAYVQSMLAAVDITTCELGARRKALEAANAALLEERRRRGG